MVSVASKREAVASAFTQQTVMKWIKTPNGDYAHAVLRRSAGKTLCGLSIAGGKVTQLPEDGARCCNCDRRWRELAVANKPKTPKRLDLTDYHPQYTYKDWEDA